MLSVEKYEGAIVPCRDAQADSRVGGRSHLSLKVTGTDIYGLLYILKGRESSYYWLQNIIQLSLASQYFLQDAKVQLCVHDISLLAAL